MQRQIKFRYWNDVSKMMVHNPVVPTMKKEEWSLDQYFSDRGWVWQQFTGLLDKNGKEIYEGDVISTDDSIINDGYAAINENFLGGSPVKPTTFNFKVQWDNDDASFALVAIDGDDEMELSTIHDWDRDMTVIGNIWEHPELLKI